MGRAKKIFMQTAVKRPGALHRKLRVPMDKKIPEMKLEKASHSKNRLLQKEAVLAETFNKYRPK